MRNRSATWLALLLCFLNIALALASLVLAVLNGYTLRQAVSDHGQFAGTLFFVLSFSAIGALVATRRPDNPLGWIYGACAFSESVAVFADQYAEYALITHPGWLAGGLLMSWLGGVSWLPGACLLLTFALLLFPTGRLPGPRWRMLGWFCITPLVAFVPVALAFAPVGGRVLPEQSGQVQLTGVLSLLASILLPLMLMCGLASIISLVVRFRGAQGIERQQLKWLIYAAAATLVSFGLRDAIPSTGAFQVLLFILWFASFLLIPAAIAIALLRYRLFDIDVIIRRTLVYSLLTLTLGLVYVGCIVLLQQLAVPLVGGSELAIVASTLAIAALFTPLRRRIQTLIDKRFYRRKYDAAKVLASFAATARDETNLEQLTTEMLRVVDETVQPEFVWVWLKPVDGAKREG
jgi:hypothetical protein